MRLWTYEWILRTTCSWFQCLSSCGLPLQSITVHSSILTALLCALRHNFFNGYTHLSSYFPQTSVARLILKPNPQLVPWPSHKVFCRERFRWWSTICWQVFLSVLYLKSTWIVRLTRRPDDRTYGLPCIQMKLESITRNSQNWPRTQIFKAGWNSLVCRDLPLVSRPLTEHSLLLSASSSSTLASHRRITSLASANMPSLVKSLLVVASLSMSALAATYSQTESHIGADFLNAFTVEAIPDPTNGRV